MFAAWRGANWGASSMMTRPAGSSRYNVFCGSSGRQSAAVEVASTSAEVNGRCADSAGGGGGTLAVASAALRETAAGGAAAPREPAAACVTKLSAANTGTTATVFNPAPLTTRSTHSLDSLDQ